MDEHSYIVKNKQYKNEHKWTPAPLPLVQVHALSL